MLLHVNKVIDGEVVPVEIDATEPLPIQNVSAAPVDRSSSITAGGEAQNAAVEMLTRKAYFFQNISSETMWGSFVGTAAPNAAGSFPIFPNGVIKSSTVCETTALSIYGATTGKIYTMWEM